MKLHVLTSLSSLSEVKSHPDNQLRFTVAPPRPGVPRELEGTSGKAPRDFEVQAQGGRMIRLRLVSFRARLLPNRASILGVSEFSDSEAVNESDLTTLQNRNTCSRVSVEALRRRADEASNIGNLTSSALKYSRRSAPSR
jgi:hypothetical protein